MPRQKAGRQARKVPFIMQSKQRCPNAHHRNAGLGWPVERHVRWQIHSPAKTEVAHFTSPLLRKEKPAMDRRQRHELSNASASVQFGADQRKTGRLATA